MKTLKNLSERQNIARRMGQLSAADKARWGSMSVHQMVCHLDDSYKVPLGERTASPATGFLQRTVVKWAALKRADAVAPGISYPAGDGTRERGHGSSGFLSGSSFFALHPEPFLRSFADPMPAASHLRKNDSGGLDALGIFARGSPPASVWPLSTAGKKRHTVWSGAFCVNDGAVRYGPRRCSGCFIGTFLRKPTREAFLFPLGTGKCRKVRLFREKSGKRDGVPGQTEMHMFCGQSPLTIA